MNSLAIAGFRGGSLAIQGFSGALGAPVPPVVTASRAYNEFGAGTVGTIHVGESQVIIGPWQTVDRTQLEIKLHLRSNVVTHLNYEFSTDKGATWYVGGQVVAVSTPVDDGGNYLYEAHAHLNVGYWWRISAYNADLSDVANIAFEWRFHEF